MPGTILIVDPVATNRIVLRSRVATSLHNVTQANSWAGAEKLLNSEQVNLILFGPGMTDADALAGLVNLQHLQRSKAVPVLRLRQDWDLAATCRLMAAGAADVLGPNDQSQLLLAKIRKLMRQRSAITDWKARGVPDETSLGLAEAGTPFDREAQVVLVTQNLQIGRAWAQAVQPFADHQYHAMELREALTTLPRELKPDLFIIEDRADFHDDSLRLLAELRCRTTSRHAAIITVASSHDEHRLITENQKAMALDIGADDVLSQGFQARELALRLHKQLARKRVEDHWRDGVSNQLRDAVRDPLTGVYNRRYAIPQIQKQARKAKDTETPFALLMIDIDKFKSVNDTYGHATGDVVLKEVAQRLQDALRSEDLLARIGGEEFLVSLPNTSLEEARRMATKLCFSVGDQEISTGHAGPPIRITVSIGIATSDMVPPEPTYPLPDGTGDHAHDLASKIMSHADRALYAAKSKGRNRINIGLYAA